MAIASIHRSMMRGLCVLLALSLQAPPEAGSSSPEDADLLAGIALVKDGDFEAAVPKLDAAIRNLEAQPQQAKELTRAYLYLGVTYLGWTWSCRPAGSSARPWRGTRISA